VVTRFLAWATPGLTWLYVTCLDILVVMQAWFDHQNGYDQTPPDWKGPI
jgi:hypothetical protein